MNVAKAYGDAVRKKIRKNPKLAGDMIQFGLRAEQFRLKHFADKKLPNAYKYLNYMGIKTFADSLKKPQNCIWTNVFAPVEIMESFDLNCISMECTASFLSGFFLEDYFIDLAEEEGIASTLCSYHKNFIGAARAGILKKPLMGVTTSMICDGNINTFRYLHESLGLDEYVIDIPHTYSKSGEAYVVDQLHQLTAKLEEKTQRKFDEEKLKEILKRENASKKVYASFMEKRKKHTYPVTLTLILFMLFATHLDIGSKWALHMFKLMEKEIESYPEDRGKRIFWVHLTPYAQETLKSYLNYGKDISIVCDDFNLDYMEELDTDHPFEALARKMINNIYNGDFRRKTEAIAEYVKKYNCDALVEFCHWGCKQSSGGAMLIKEEMRKISVPMLILDGDALDRRNSHDGQIKTRFEAFLELLNGREE